MAPSYPLQTSSDIPYDVPEKENNSLHKRASLCIGGIVLLLHIWFLCFLEDKYLQNYQHINDTIVVKDYIFIVVPIFLVSIFVELVYCWWKKPDSHIFRATDSISSSTLGTLNQLTKKLVGQASFVFSYYFFLTIV